MLRKKGKPIEHPRPQSTVHVTNSGRPFHGLQRMEDVSLRPCEWLVAHCSYWRMKNYAPAHCTKATVAELVEESEDIVDDAETISQTVSNRMVRKKQH